MGDKQREFKLGAARQFMNKKEVREAADWKLMELRLVSAGSMSRITLERSIDKWYLPQSKGIHWRGWHSFRRGLASTLFELGCDDLTVQRILRHAKVTVTREHCTKPRDPKVEEAMSVSRLQWERVMRLSYKGRTRERQFPSSS